MEFLPADPRAPAPLPLHRILLKACTMVWTAAVYICLEHRIHMAKQTIYTMCCLFDCLQTIYEYIHP